jgi:hypothetical protein
MDEVERVCGVGCAAGRKGELLLCGFRKGHKGKHAWATLPTFVAGRSMGDDSFAAGVEAAAKWLERVPVSPPVAKGHWGNAAGALRRAVASDWLEREDAHPLPPR